MNPSTCPKCGHQADAAAAACPDCGQALSNGAAPLSAKPPPPPEVSTWVIEKTPPDMLAWARQTIDEEEILAELEEIKRGGGLELKDFIDEIEGRIKRGE
jgi:hypothetical protein